jgi:hypothetical protein
MPASSLLGNSLLGNSLATSERFELPTRSLGRSRSIQLSYEVIERAVRACCTKGKVGFL